MPHEEGMVRASRLNALERLLLSQPHRAWRTKEIADHFAVSVDTTSDDLAELSLRGRVPLTTDGKGPSTRWILAGTITAPPLPPLHLDYVQGAALYAAARLLSQQQDERNDAVRLALSQLVSVMPDALRPHLEALVTEVTPTESRANVSSIFSALSQGWLSRRIVRVSYEPPRSRSGYECRFAPYLLEPSGIGRTMYFIGHSDPPGALRTYKLERIRSAELTDEAFEIPPDYDGVALLRRAWGVMYGNGEPMHLKLRFSQFVSKRVRETIWHTSQVLRETAEGLEWEAEIGDLTEIRPWIRGWGADCEVLEPSELRDEMIREVNRLQRRYGLSRTTLSDDEIDQTLLDALYGKE
jgi:predicted DNA-binding transcriptional regulator YafY